MKVPFVETLAAWGDSPALVSASGIVTYRELADRIVRGSRQHDDRRKLVGIEAGNCEAAVVAYLTALHRGDVVALLPPGDAAAAGNFRRDFRPDLYYTSTEGHWRTGEGSNPATPAMHPDLCLLLSTSGSTGVSRSVRLSAGAVAANAASIAAFLALTDADRGALTLPLHYSYGLSILNSHLSVGASLFLPSKSILDPGFADDLVRFGVTNLSGVPYSFELFERIGLRDAELPALRFMTVAGGRLSPSLITLYRTFMEQSGRRFFVMYGQTEATARIAYVPPEKLADHEDCIGVAIPGGMLSLADGDGVTIDAIGAPGELVYSGPNIMMGYAESRSDLSRADEIDRLKTGDLAERTHDGMFRIVGRLRRMSKIAGLRISHDALEKALADDGVNAVVCGDDQKIRAYFTSHQAQAEVRAALARRSGLTQLHTDARQVETIPRLANGKIDYQTLEALALDAADIDVRSAFRQAFFPAPVGDGDSFQSLGGDSLRYVELSISLERHLGSLPDGWERMSIRNLAGGQRARPVRRQIRMDIALRAIAILFVVFYHEMLWPITGGSALMLALVGYSLARFQTANLASGRINALLRPLGHVLIPYAAIVAGYSLAWGQVPWASVFLAGNLGIADPARHGMLPFLYWFVEIYVQTLLLCAALAFCGPVRRVVAAAPLRAGLIMLGMALALRFALPGWIEIGNRQIFTPYWNLHIIAFGWCAYHAATRAEKWLVALAATAVFGFLGMFDGVWIGTAVKYSLLLSGVMGLLFLPQVALPRSVAALLLMLAAASYHIYLFHRFVPELLMAPLVGRLPDGIFHAGSIAGGIALGLLVWTAQRQAVRLSASRRLRSVDDLPAGTAERVAHNA